MKKIKAMILILIFWNGFILGRGCRSKKKIIETRLIRYFLTPEYVDGQKIKWRIPQDLVCAREIITRGNKFYIQYQNCQECE